ncbi:MAG: sigma-70 family RNA polymerase sigma factor [Lachnospiraceae bacterium]|nr:sigma-70 family RNA polymerase sigma factor [Lachnospiraceae bacterium]
MDDREIIALFWDRNEEALAAVQEQYGRMMLRLAGRILASKEDAEEVVSDALLDAWNAIPPHRPEHLLPFLGRIVRRRAIDRYRRETADKRGGSEMALALEELENSLAGGGTPEEIWESKALAEAVAEFVRGLKEPARGIFIRRYWYLDTAAEIAAHIGSSPARVGMILTRTRRKLAAYLKEKEWIE